MNQSKIHFTLNNQPCAAEPGESILSAARRAGVDIPNLCYHPRQDAEANCRSCVVEIKGERVLAPACRRHPTDGMVVNSQSNRARSAQQNVLALLYADVERDALAEDNAMDDWAGKMGWKIPASLYPGNVTRHHDTSHPAFEFDASACILCTRCVRACSDIQGNEVIGLQSRGGHTRIEFDLDAAIADGSCVGCGECVQACPTGALRNRRDTPDEAHKTDSVCPYCGVGCQLTYFSHEGKLVKVEGRDGPANQERLCVKGRYGFDYVHHPHRLTQPLKRREGIPKGLNAHFDPADPLKMFEPISWEAAIAIAGNGLKQLRTQHGDSVLAGFGSAKCSNEEAYLFQKLVRTGFGNHNVDHCTRLCHASSVAALLEGIGSGAVSNPVEDVKHADVIVVIGSDTTGNHPVAATFIKNAQKAGATLIVLDPRRIELARHADHFLQFKPDTDVAVLNALLHTIIEENLFNQSFIDQRTTHFEDVKANVEAYSPEAMQAVCGIDAKTLRQIARIYATAKNAIIFWGMGVSQHIHGTDNVRCLISLCMVAGQIGRPGTGLHPLRGQNNVQGASDAGLIPMMYPDYQHVSSTAAQQKFSAAWDTPLSHQPGLTVVEIMHAIHEGQIRGMYIMGENPAMSDPNLNHARSALAQLEHLVVQDIFLTETAAFADIVLPAAAWPEKEGSVTNTDRRVQRGRQAIPPPGDAKPDHWIIQQIARQIGLDWQAQSVDEVYEEMRSVMPSLEGISWARLSREGAVTYPCTSDDDPGQPVVFTDRFPTENGRARLVPARLIPADEHPDKQYPFVLITGRRLEHWHTGSMTRRAQVLDSLDPSPVIDIHPSDAKAIKLQNGQAVTVASRRGQVQVRLNISSAMQPGEVFMPFCFQEAAANLLTNEALDPYGKIPEFKYCAVALHPS